MRGVDYSSGRPGAAQLAAAGYGFIARYLSRTPSKNITFEEARAARSAGLDVVLVWESTADRALAGAAAGQQDGATARTMADEVSAPARAAIYFAVDFPARPADYARIGEYRDAFAAAIAPRPDGVYGPGPLIRFLKARGCRYGWQPGATSWSGNRVWEEADLLQLAQQVRVQGVVCDVDETRRADYGGWAEPAAPPAPGPNPTPPAPAPPTPIQEDDEMPRAFKAIDPETGEAWFCRQMDGAIYMAPGSTLPFLGGLNTHAEWNAVRADDPVVEFAAWKDGAGRWGYCIVTQDAEDGQSLHFYTFPRDGSQGGH